MTRVAVLRPKRGKRAGTESQGKMGRTHRSFPARFVRSYQSRWSLAILVGVLTIGVDWTSIASAQFAPAVRKYNIRRGTPIIDGADTGDWSAADAAAGNWRLLREPTAPPDLFNNRFQMLWDDDALYVRVMTDSSVQGMLVDGNMDFNVDNLNLYFDPNRDGEANGGSQFSGPNTAVDGYRIVANNFAGDWACGQDGIAFTADDCSIEVDADPANPLQTGSVFGTLAAAHVDTLFGNQAEWQGMRETSIAQSHGSTGGMLEMKIPWADFDAPQPDAGGNPTGLNLQGAIPVNRETWFFNAGVITTDPLNFLPVWNWHNDPNGTEFFPSHPHGEITFRTTRGPDINGDGRADCADINLLQAEIVAGTHNVAIDLTGDGLVNGADREAWLEEAAVYHGFTTAYQEADFNLDRSVDVTDFNIWNGNKFTMSSAFCGGDSNYDGVVDVPDFNAWNRDKFTAAELSPSGGGLTAAVPEPTSLAGSCWALGGIAWLVRRRRTCMAPSSAARAARSRTAVRPVEIDNLKSVALRRRSSTCH